MPLPLAGIFGFEELNMFNCGPLEWAPLLHAWQQATLAQGLPPGLPAEGWQGFQPLWQTLCLRKIPWKVQRVVEVLLGMYQHDQQSGLKWQDNGMTCMIHG